MAVPNLPPKIVVSRYLEKHCDLWVWDFDDTLIDTTTYYIKSMEPCDIRKRTCDELNKEIPPWPYFKELVEYLVMSGKRVGIASFGLYEVIKAYMDRIFGYNQQYFTRSNIMASCKDERLSREYRMPKNKNSYIKKMMEFYRIQDFSSVVLFDDNPSNIADATAIGILTVQVGGRNQNELGTFIDHFNEDLMKNMDYKQKVSCGDDFFLRNKFGALGERKGVTTDKHFGVDDKYIFSDRIYVDQRKQRKRKRDSEAVKLRKLKEEQRRKRVKSYSQDRELRYGAVNEPFKTNIDEIDEQIESKCEFCSTVGKDQYIWILLALLIIFLVHIARK